MSVAIQQLAKGVQWSALPNRLWKVAGSVSVRTKILGIVLALTVLLGLGVTLQVRTVMVQVFMSELETRGLSVVSDLAARSTDLILLNDNYALYELLVATVNNHPDALYAYVVDPQGHVLAHTFGDMGFPTALLALQRGNTTHVAHFDSPEGRVHEFDAPIFEGRAGQVRLGLVENRLRSIINAVTGQMLLTTLVVAIAGIGAAMLLTWVLTRPILDLVETTRQVGRGNLYVQAVHWADDEIGALADAFSQMVMDLNTSRQAITEKDAVRSRLLEQLITAQEEERKRIARELHDGVGQTLTSLIWNIEVMAQLADPAALQPKSAELRAIATNALEQVRLISRQLRPSVLDDLGLVAALQRYVEEFSRLYPQLAVDLHCELPNRLPPLVEITLYRIIQEAMTNAARHAQGNLISILLTQREGAVQAIIEDDGHGFDPDAARRAGQSVGIHGMAERADLINGRLDIESNAEGTAVYVEAPL
jgi:signal transduction histidine kinase